MSEQVIEKPVAATAPTTPNPEEVERKKREVEIKKRGAELKAEKDGLNKQRAAILAEQESLKKEKQEIAEFNRWRAQATVDPDAFLGPVYGKDWRDKLAKATAGDTTPLAVQQLREEWEKERRTRAEQDEKVKADAKAKEEESKKAKANEEEQLFADYMKHLQGPWAKEHEKEYPTLVSTGLSGQVALKIRASRDENGNLPKPLEELEKEIAASLEAELDKLLETVHATPKWSEKLAAKFKAAPPVAKPKEAPQFQYKPKSPPSGISQSMGSGTRPEEKLTREQRKARLVGMSDDEWGKKVGVARSMKGTADE